MSEYKQNPKNGSDSTYSGNNLPAKNSYGSIDANVSSAYNNMNGNNGRNSNYGGMSPMMPQGLIPGQAYLIIPIGGMNNQSGGNYGGINELVNNIVSMYSQGTNGPRASGYNDSKVVESYANLGKKAA